MGPKISFFFCFWGEIILFLQLYAFFCDNLLLRVLLSPMFWILKKYHLIFESADFSFILSAKIGKNLLILNLNSATL